MAKSRYRRRGATRGRLKVKMLGKGCSTLNKRLKKSLQNRVHMILPATRPKRDGAQIYGI